MAVLLPARDIIAPLATLRVIVKIRSKNNPAIDEGPRLLVAWTDPLTELGENLRARLAGRVVPEMDLSWAPDEEFWRDVNVPSPFPGRGVVDSIFAHAALLGLLYAVSIWPSQGAHLLDPLAHRAMDGYTLSQYLPELRGAPTRKKAQGKHDPVLAKQEIVSLPETPDNLRQTIVTPPKLKLQRDVALPNIVAYDKALPVQPLEASERDSVKLRLPDFMPEVVGPTVETGALRSQTKLPAFEPRIVEPAPDVAVESPRLALPTFAPRVVEPAPELGHVSRGSSTNLAHLAPQVRGPVPEAPGVGDALRGTPAQVIALNLHPVEVHAPVVLPEGNRSGAFAASPKGKPDAAGTPGADAATGSVAREMAGKPNAPAGIHVSGAAPATAVTSPNAPVPNVQADPTVKAKLMAAMRAPMMTAPPRQPAARESTGARSELENRIFAGRRSYTLAVNMPNLNTATGSWIIHFVEREPGAVQSPIAAPEVVSKSDPAYPGELIQDGVQGTVVLTAIIKSDGSVAEIAVAKSLDPKLDQNAAEALGRWLFRPALKDGKAIDLEAVITVPFRPKPAGF